MENNTWKKILFLDIDGVLASVDFLCRTAGRTGFIDKEKVALLNKLKPYGVEVVISSSWGYNEDTVKQLTACGLDLPIIGGTDIIIFAFGTDLTESEDYSGEKFEYYKQQGYNYFCNVDSSKYFVQLRDNYLRMGRRNLDGYRIYKNAIGAQNNVSDLFDASEILDPDRPPVPEL